MTATAEVFPSTMADLVSRAEVQERVSVMTGFLCEHVLFVMGISVVVEIDCFSRF